MKLENLFNEYKALSKAQLVEKGREAYSLFGTQMDKAGYDKKEVVSFATMLVRLAAGADNFGTKEELELFEAITGIDTDEYEFAAMTKNANEESFVNQIDQIVDSLNAEAKEAALRFAALFLSADNRLGEKEKALFQRLEA